MRIRVTRFSLVIAALLGPLLALALWAMPVAAQSEGNPALDALFAQLRDAPDPATAQAIDRQIWTAWVTPDDPELAARMQAAMAKLGRDPSGALTAFQAIAADHPDYAEAWNQLATLHFVLGDYDTSLVEIDKVLKLEPRHFGALAGRAMIYRSQGKRALAVKDMAAALALHPFLAERALFPELLEDVTHI